MEKTFDRITVGQNIRNERKNKKITLEQLASGICSIGKMSNIENGLTDIQMDDLIKIAEKLKIPHKQLINTNTKNHIKILNRIEDAEICISLDMGQDALALIEKIRENFKEDIQSNQALLLNLNFVEGQAFLKIGNDFNATTLFYQMLSFPTTSQKDIILRAKAQHKLGELFAKNTQYRMAIEHMEKAVDELQVHKLDVPWRLYYNLAILNMYQRQYEKASVYLTFIRHKNPRLQYVDALLHLFSDNYRNGMEKLHLSRAGLIEMNDTEMLIKSVIATLYFSSFSPTEYKERIENTLNFFENELIRTRYRDDSQIELLVITLHSVISTNLHTTNLLKAEQYLILLFDFEERHNFLKYRYISLFLRALLLKKMKTISPEEIDHILEEAEIIMKKADVHNIHLFNILYERSLLNDDTNSFAFKALNTIRTYSNLETLDLIHFEHFMPEVLPI